MKPNRLRGCGSRTARFRCIRFHPVSSSVDRCTVQLIAFCAVAVGVVAIRRRGRARAGQIALAVRQAGINCILRNYNKFDRFRQDFTFYDAVSVFQRVIFIRKCNCNRHVPLADFSRCVARSECVIRALAQYRAIR